MKRIKFAREPNGEWYAVIPEWFGDRAALQMVCGADDLLRMIAEGDQEVTLTISLEEFEGCETLVLVGTPEHGGGDYLLSRFRGMLFDMNVWICPVVEFVFGHVPKRIYFI